MTFAPADGYCGGGEEAPGEEPDDVKEPVERGGELVVVTRDAGAQKARDVLVVEVEPRPAGVRWEAGADGHGHGWIAQRGEDVPWRGDCEKECDAGEGMQQPPSAPFTGEDQEETDGREEEDDRHEALGEHGAGK